LTSEIPYEKGRGFRYYLDAVGGADAKGWKKRLIITPMVRRMWRVHSCFFELSKVTLVRKLLFRKKKKDEYGEFVSIAGFWPVGRCYYCDIG
jgi:hypothetical protein